VVQVFDGSGTFELGPQRFEVTRGDVVAIPSWCPTRIVADSTLDAFVFSDAPVYEALKLYRATTEQWGEVT
jgi:gentisate 1,2-dioxygenase